MPREIRLSPEGDAVAIRSDQPDPEARNAWGIMRANDGGCWARTSQVIDWIVLQ